MTRSPSSIQPMTNGSPATRRARLWQPVVSQLPLRRFTILFVGSRLAAILTLAIVGNQAAPGRAAEMMSLEELRQTRGEQARQRCRVTMNNDGCDVLYFPKEEKATVEAFLSKRTTPLAGTHVDRIAFCSISSGFSNFTHNTKIGTLLSRSGYEFDILPNTRNISRELIDQGTDCLQAVVEFGHRHQMEVFWSFRMNDTHDAAHRPDKPYFLFPPLKQEHPDWLLGEPVKRTPHGRWSSVDYALPQIRDLAFGYIDEVCRNYDVDGVELDFFRHLCYFKSTANGGVASGEERAMMTSLMRRVRKMTEEVGLQRGRPILISVRVPDSVGFCRDMGFAIEQWMSEGLIDILITTCYFRLNPWEYSVKLGHEHDVQVTPCLSDSRVRGETRFRRSSAKSYRGRAMNAWNAGADGLHLFNSFNPNAPMWKELGDPEALATMDKLYFVNVRDDDPRRFLANGREYRTVPVMGPSHPRLITADGPITLPIEIGDDLSKARRDGYKSDLKIHLEVPSIQRVEQLQVKLNGTELTGGLLNQGWVDYPAAPACVEQGVNEVEIGVDPSALGADDWSVVYDGENKPSKHWHRDRGSVRAIEKLTDGALLIADRGEVSGDYLYYRYPWGAEPSREAVVEARVKAKAGSSYIIVANGIGGERLGIWPDRIDLYHNPKLQYKMKTTDDFHLYRMELKGSDLKVYVDGELRIDAAGALGPRSGYAKNEVAFGAANSGQMGEAYWASIKARASGMTCRDLVVSVAYAKE
jgi:Glycosyl hydrolase-like 10